MDAESWEQKKLQVLLDAGKAANERSRLVFVIINIAGIILLSAQFNELATWLRHVVTRPEVIRSDKVLTAMDDLLYKDLYAVSVPVLGLKFSVADLSIVGSVCMAVLVVWFFFVTRRENHVVDAVTKEANKAIQQDNLEKAAYLYYGIVHYFVFVPITKVDVPGKESSNRFARVASFVLLFIPFWTLVVVALTDAATLIMPSKFDPNKMLWETLGNRAVEGEALNAVQAEALIRIAFCGIMSLFCLKQCKLCRGLETETRERLNEVRLAVECSVSNTSQSATVS